MNELHAAVVACERCPRLRRYCAEVARVKVRRYRDETYWGRPVPGFGDPRARMLIIGLAPAAHGGNRTGRVFTGDDSGNWLYGTLYKFGFSSRERSLSRDDGLRLHDCYITAAAHCAPPANKPTRAEIDRCGLYLEQELALLTRLRLVVTLGRIAHDAWLRSSGWWDRLPPGKRPPFGHGLLTRLPDGKSVLAAYHPSRQNTQTGRLTRPMWETIFRRARRLLDTERPGGLDA